MKKALLLLLVSSLLLSLTGCTTPVASAQVLQSDKPRDTAPAVAPADQKALVNGNDAFAFDLYRVLAATGGNLFYSPYSISEALAMTYAGARTNTATDMAKTLSFTLSQDTLHPAFNNIDLQLAQRGQGAKGKDDKGFRLHVVNAIWGQQGYPFQSPYLDVLAKNYGAGLRVLDFIKQAEPSRVTINQWVSDQTEGKIKDLIPQGVIDQMTRLVLTNAVYFNAAWQYQFEKSATSDGTFNLIDNSTVTVPMMHQTKSFNYYAGSNYQAVEMPYDGRQLAMVILLPQAGQFAAFEKSLNAGQVQTTIDKMVPASMALTMPKFQYESSLGLKQPLSTLGMGVAFTSDADFSGIDGKKDLLIQDVLHKAYVAVDETGTEAAAATAVVVGTTSMPIGQIEVKVDRPFIFFIRDIPTGTIIFVGRVMNPAK